MPDLINIDDIKNAVDEIEDKLIKFRREIHMAPELSGKEEKTAAFVAGVLEAHGVEVTTNVGGHGVVGIIKGGVSENGDGGGVVALRGDMDALPMQDYKSVEYASKVPGIMHSCGHDGHTAILLGAAITLSKLKDKMTGTVKFIFQPSEETPPSGAKAMIEDGVLEDPKPTAIAALHVFPEIEAGKVAVRGGAMAASADRVHIVIKGKSGHASKPHQSVDAILVAANVTTALHHIVSRRLDPMDPVVISIGMVEGGKAENIIADMVELKGTVRTLTPEARKIVPEIIEETVKGVVLSHGADYEFDYKRDYPVVDNDEEVNSFMSTCIEDVLGEGSLVEMEHPSMGSEDFSFFSEAMPAVLIRLGVRNEKKGITSYLHNSNFDLDERALAMGAKIMSWFAVKYLANCK